ncbi:uncharacterized protein [Lolium perenne]|jgi:hypothetical protein|uniref:uncharacterized protein n=1 Tax=Lolium perenne TaxID=4522 RepID=UPI003A991FDE
MGGCICKPQTTAPWPDLPPEIAGRIFSCLPSHEDRLSFAAVSSQWRLAAGLQKPLPPPVPCINLDHGTYQRLVDGKVRRFPAAKGYRAGASFGRWLLYYHKGSGRCFLRAPVSANPIELPCFNFSTAMAWAIREQPPSIFTGSGMEMKIVLCSSHHVFALFRHPCSGFFRPVSYLASFRPAELRDSLILCSFRLQPPAHAYTDIVFYDGKLFALSRREDLFCLELFTDDRDYMIHHLIPTVDHDMEAHPFIITNRYLVVSADKQKLLMVRWRRRMADDQRAIDMWVFEADFGKARWLEVKDLGGQVIFLGRSCSMAFPASQTEHWGPRFRGGNRVFVLGTEWARQPLFKKRDIPRYCVYDMASGKTSLVSLRRARFTKTRTSGWFFPTSENL